MTLQDLINQDAVEFAQQGNLRVISVKLPDCETRQEFAAKSFINAVALAERGIKWTLVEIHGPETRIANRLAQRYL
jgi:hypothetical protein